MVGVVIRLYFLNKLGDHVATPFFTEGGRVTFSIFFFNPFINKKSALHLHFVHFFFFNKKVLKFWVKYFFSTYALPHYQIATLVRKKYITKCICGYLINAVGTSIKKLNGPQRLNY